MRVAALKRAGTSPHPFVTARVEDPALVGELEAAKVRSTGRAGARAGKDAVAMADFEEAIERVVGRSRAQVPHYDTEGVGHLSAP